MMSTIGGAARNLIRAPESEISCTTHSTAVPVEWPAGADREVFAKLVNQRWCSRLNRLPGTERITEIDPDVGGNRETLVGTHLFALIPGQLASQLVRQRADVLGKRGNNSRRVLVENLNEHREAVNALDEGNELCVSFAPVGRSPSQCPPRHGLSAKRSLSGNSKRRSAPASNGSVAFDALDGGQSAASKCNVVAATKRTTMPYRCRGGWSALSPKQRSLWVQNSPGSHRQQSDFCRLLFKAKETLQRVEKLMGIE
jgi:hypothetical protein